MDGPPLLYYWGLAAASTSDFSASFKNYLNPKSSGGWKLAYRDPTHEAFLSWQFSINMEEFKKETIVVVSDQS